MCIGEAPSTESYLNIPNLLSAAVSRGADAIHPVRSICVTLFICVVLYPRQSIWQSSAVVHCYPEDWFAQQGYGFLSENAAFVDICKDHGINFIGPNSDSIRTMGDKSTARDTMKVQTACATPRSYLYPRLHISLTSIFNFISQRPAE